MTSDSENVYGFHGSDFCVSAWPAGPAGWPGARPGAPERPARPCSTAHALARILGTHFMGSVLLNFSPF